MPRPKHLTFANVAAVSALVIATAGGGFSVAAGLAKNSVGSAQIKNGSIKGKDVKDNALTGKDVKESTLGTVPSATKASSATTTDAVTTKRVNAAPGQTVVIATNSTLVVELTCTDNGGGDLESSVNIRTTADHAAFDANLDGSEESDFMISDGPEDIVSDSGTTQGIEDGGFAAITAGGVSWKGYGFAAEHFGGSNVCTGEMTFWG
jgi:hypothetical protein